MLVQFLEKIKVWTFLIEKRQTWNYLGTIKKQDIKIYFVLECAKIPILGARKLGTAKLKQKFK